MEIVGQPQLGCITLGTPGMGVSLAVKTASFTADVRLFLAPRLSEQLDPILVQDVSNRIGRVTAVSQSLFESLQIGDRIQVGGELIGAHSAVKIAANCDMPAVTGQLTDVVDMVDGAVKCDMKMFIPRSDNPAMQELPVAQGNSNDTVAFENRSNLGVVEFTLMRNQLAAIRMTCDQWPMVKTQSLPE